MARRVIGNVMSGVLPVFEDLAKARWDQGRFSDHNQQLVRALDLDLRDVAGAEQALHALADLWARRNASIRNEAAR